MPNPADVQSSPSKIKRERFQLLPNTVNAARRLLTSFALTNSPESLFRTIPACEKDLSADYNEDDQESILAKESLRVIRAKTCWDLLKSDFIKALVPATPSRKTKRRKRNDDPTDDEEESLNMNQIVGDDAWAMLEWMVAVFEREESLIAPGERRYPLILRRAL